MKNTVPFILSLLFFLTSDLQAQVKKYVFGDSIFVWASSLNMRESPHPSAKVVGKVPYGSAVVVVDDSIGKVAYKFKAVAEDTLDSGEKTKPFYLHGFWVKVNFDGTVGYVFDGYLSTLAPLKVPLPTWWEHIQTWAKQTLHLKPKIIREDDCKDMEFIAPKSPIKIETGCSGEGGCGYVNLWMKNRDFEECAMLAIQIFGPKKMTKRGKNEVFFAIENCVISIKTQGEFVIIYHICCC